MPHATTWNGSSKHLRHSSYDPTLKKNKLKPGQYLFNIFCWCNGESRQYYQKAALSGAR